MFLCLCVLCFFFSDQRLRFQGSCGWAGSEKRARPTDKGAGVCERERVVPLSWTTTPIIPRQEGESEGRPGRLPGNGIKLHQL